MTLLTRDKFLLAEEFINSSARPLEAALFAVAFRGAAQDWALAELAAFQNEDGGFGRGLEPDLQLPDSSVLATTVALQILRNLHVADDHELIHGAMRFLISTYDAASKAWPIIPSNPDDAPHAPWWQYNPDLESYLSNPRAEIVGYLFDYPALVPQGLGESLLNDVFAHLESMQGHVEMHELLCYLRLLNTESLPADARDWLNNQLQPIVKSSVALDTTGWDQYGLKPLMVAPTPRSQFAQVLSKAIFDNLDYEIEKQGADGAWTPPWSWGDSYPDAWPHAQRAWKGILTVNTTRTLSAYDRISSA